MLAYFLAWPWFNRDCPVHRVDIPQSSAARHIGSIDLLMPQKTHRETFPFARLLSPRAPSRRRCGRLLILRTRQESGSSPVLQPVALSANVDRRRVVQQPVQDRGRDDRIAEDRAPIAVALVRGQDDAAPFVARADQLEEDSSRPDRPAAGSPFRQSPAPSAPGTRACADPAGLRGRPAQIGHQIVRRHEVGGLAGLDRRLRQRMVMATLYHSSCLVK